jgi:endonuclease G
MDEMSTWRDWMGALWYGGASRTDYAPRLVGETEDNVLLSAVSPEVTSLAQLSLLANSVGSVRIDERPVATGFLLADGRFVTCHHVLPTRAVAARASVLFERYEHGQTAAMVRCAVDPATLRTRAAEDVSTVRLCAQDGTPAGLVAASDDVGAGDEVAMIHRPCGGKALVSSRWKRVSVVLRARAEVRYDLDTAQGSSGAPVFDRAWRVVAVHCDAGPIRDDGRAQYNQGTLIRVVPGTSLQTGERR